MNVYLEMAGWFYEADEKVKAEKKKAYEDGKTDDYFLSRLDAIAKENNGYLAAKKATWADLWFLGTFSYMNFMAGKDLISNYPNLLKVQDNISSHPNIKKWLETRPKSWDL
jgi:glutathione S-transferase